MGREDRPHGFYQVNQEMALMSIMLQQGDTANKFASAADKNASATDKLVGLLERQTEQTEKAQARTDELKEDFKLSLQSNAALRDDVKDLREDVKDLLRSDVHLRSDVQELIETAKKAAQTRPFVQLPRMNAALGADDSNNKKLEPKPYK